MPRARMAIRPWPDAPQALGRRSLPQRLQRLQRLPQPGGDDWLEARATLRIAPDCVDLQTAASWLREDPTPLQGESLNDLDYSDIDGLDDSVRVAR